MRLTEGRNFQLLTLVKHGGGGLPRQRDGRLAPEREKRSAPARSITREEENEANGPWRPFPTLRCRDFRRQARGGGDEELV